MSEGYLLPRTADPTDPLRLGVLISGSGSGLEALLRHQQNAVEAGHCCHETVIVISDKPGVKGLVRAANFEVSAEVAPLPPRADFDDATAWRHAHEEEIDTVLDAHDVELVVCSGYMRILTARFLMPRLGRVINIHPSPWGPDGALFPGAHGVRDLLVAGHPTAGASVHFVTPGVDDGPLIATEETPVGPDEDEDALGARVRAEIEHRLYPAVIDAIAAGRVTFDGDRVRVHDGGP